MSNAALIAVDVGNNRLKFGCFDAPSGAGLPEPSGTLSLAGQDPDLAALDRWLGQIAQPTGAWWIGSVNRPAATRLIDWLRDRLPEAELVLLAAGDLPLIVELPRPDMVGIDRLLDALAANRLRLPGRPAVVVDVGTAITVDLVSAEGAFRGGAILPGSAMAARAMHEFTDLLPLIEPEDLAVAPPALGTATEPAMRSGLFWGAVGAIRELIARLGQEVSAEPQVFLTGGAGPTVAGLLGRDALHVPHLTLAGIALAAH
jgi:type III pantothenate kinase